ncbi:thioesterase superfamily protein [Actinocorallia herbida]|uniref:Thioesterase superfamily protein n=1 Tax=Actinocorallia herbida TaxID=58109 RepID=A0A3N1CVW1_9ACTN|nr:thioesterase family protein [Actinocorallia herbida]ROO85433.1 thioesterase superfamily protein [Actinocorallia herbida]
MGLDASFDLLRVPSGEAVVPPRELWGFGGLHGGLALGLLAEGMREHAAGGALRSATARFHRSLSDAFQVRTSLDRAGRTLTEASAQAVGERGVLVDASAVFAHAREEAWPPFAPAMPAVPRPEECEVFEIPPEFVPVGRYSEIRAVGSNRPYAGGTEPALTAWIRPAGRDTPPDAALFLFLMDALAPSYAAVLDTLLFVPTVELSVRIGPALDAMTTPWVLLHARTHSASPGGWIDEHIDAWSEDGAHLGSARQLRLALPAR